MSNATFPGGRTAGRCGLKGTAVCGKGWYMGGGPPLLRCLRSARGNLQGAQGCEGTHGGTRGAPGTTEVPACTKGLEQGGGWAGVARWALEVAAPQSISLDVSTKSRGEDAGRQNVPPSVWEPVLPFLSIVDLFF